MSDLSNKNLFLGISDFIFFLLFKSYTESNTAVKIAPKSTEAPNSVLGATRRQLDAEIFFMKQLIDCQQLMSLFKFNDNCLISALLIYNISAPISKLVVFIKIFRHRVHFRPFCSNISAPNLQLKLTLAPSSTEFHRVNN